MEYETLNIKGEPTRFYCSLQKAFLSESERERAVLVALIDRMFG